MEKLWMMIIYSLCSMVMENDSAVGECAISNSTYYGEGTRLVVQIEIVEDDYVDLGSELEDDDLTFEFDEEAEEAPSTSDFDAEGFARTNCMACHGDDMASGMASKDLAALSKVEFFEKVREGPGSMPRFDENKISDEDLEKLASHYTE